MSKMHLKIQLLPANELRRIELPADYDALAQRVNEMLNHPTDPFALFYYDDEKELIRVSNNTEYQLAVELVSSMPGSVLRMVARPFVDVQAIHERHRHRRCFARQGLLCSVTSDNLPDGTRVRPQVSLNKSWRITNDTQADLAIGYTLKLVKGFRSAQLGLPQTIALSQGALAQGQSATISVDFKSPEKDGIYLAVYHIVDSKGKKTKVKCWIFIEVDSKQETDVIEASGFTEPIVDISTGIAFGPAIGPGRPPRLECKTLGKILEARGLEMRHFLKHIFLAQDGDVDAVVKRVEEFRAMKKQRNKGCWRRGKRASSSSSSSSESESEPVAEAKGENAMTPSSSSDEADADADGGHKGRRGRGNRHHHHHHHHHHHGRHHRGNHGQDEGDGQDAGKDGKEGVFNQEGGRCRHQRQHRGKKDGASALKESDIPEKSYAKLAAMGYADRSVTTPLLIEYGGRVKKVVRVLSGLSTDG